MSTRKKWFFGIFLILAVTALFVICGHKRGKVADPSDVPSYGSRPARSRYTGPDNGGGTAVAIIIWYPTTLDNNEAATSSPYKVS